MGIRDTVSPWKINIRWFFVLYKEKYEDFSHRLIFRIKKWDETNQVEENSTLRAPGRPQLNLNISQYV